MRKLFNRKSFKEIADDFFDQSNFEEKKSTLFFDVEKLDSLQKFLSSLDQTCQDKINKTIDTAKQIVDREIFKKLTSDIWEFRIRHGGLSYRLLAFKHRKAERSIVVITHGFIKKTNKVPEKELMRAIAIHSNYLYEKN